MVANGVVVDIKTGEPVNKPVEEKPADKQETTKTSTKREKK